MLCHELWQRVTEWQPGNRGMAMLAAQTFDAHGVCLEQAFGTSHAIATAENYADSVAII